MERLIALALHDLVEGDCEHDDCARDEGAPGRVNAEKAMTISAKSAPSCGSIALRKPTYIAPESPQTSPMRTSVCKRTTAMGMPAKRALRGCFQQPAHDNRSVSGKHDAQNYRQRNEKHHHHRNNAKHLH